MPNPRLRGKEGTEERHVWELLVRNFFWRVPAGFSVKIFEHPRKKASAPVRLQIFELTVAAIFANLRPEFDWYVTPNLPDGGLDFVGKGRFLEDQALGIAAAITVGGQCKKRSQVKDIVGEVSGSLARMAARINPTFFVVALASRLTENRVAEAQKILEDAHGRHCHILDRHQLEGLISDHLPIVDPILRQGLSAKEAGAVLAYFTRQRKSAPSKVSVEVRTPTRVLAGVPFRIHLDLRSPLLASSGTQIRWKPRSPDKSSKDRPTVTIIGPIGVDSKNGIECRTHSSADDPLRTQIAIEMLSYSVGRLALGEVIVNRGPAKDDSVDLGRIQIVENLRPRFYERPFRGALTKLSMQYDRAIASGVGSVAVVGAGGSGKSRLCEEFALEKRRRGCQVVLAKQTKTLDDPHRVLADLLVGLAGASVSWEDPANAVINTIAQYDENLANRSAPAIKAIIGLSGQIAATPTNQDLLSALVLLFLVRIRSAPLIVHLQDLHWCTADVLSLLERLIWQLEMTYKSQNSREESKGALFILEGRIWEAESLGMRAWSTQVFERFLEKLACPTVRCDPFEISDSLEFVRRLFEDQHSAQRLVDTSLLTLQTSLAEQIHKTAGGNPFHTLEQIKLLRERRVLAQNPETGLFYMVQPLRDEPMLPDSVFELIKVRWQYLKSSKPKLATLLWGASLLEDRIATPLFRHLWRNIGSTLSLSEIEATGFLWTGTGERAEVSFRHENYFQSLRRLEIDPTQQEKVIETYTRWFSQSKKLDAFGQFSWARVLLQSPSPDEKKIRALLDKSLRWARRQGDLSLLRRILTTKLDKAWQDNAQSPLKMPAFLKCCEEETDLCRSLLNTDRTEAAQRIDDLQIKIRQRISAPLTANPLMLQELRYRSLTADLLHSQILFNDRQPSQASDVASQAVNDIRALSKALSAAENGCDWRLLEMEALHSYAVALALGGEIHTSIDVARQAVDIARQSDSPSAIDVMSTYANILLAEDVSAAESILRDCLARADPATTNRESLDAIAINLGMALILEVHHSGSTETQLAQRRLSEASTLLRGVFANSFRIGRYPDAGAAALLLGILSALTNDSDEVSWFAQAVTASARGRQMETLWRSHINLATAIHRRKERTSEALRDHARAAMEILEDTLSAYAQPEMSGRFKLIRIPLAHAVRFLIQLGDDMGLVALERYPSLRKCFKDLRRGILKHDRCGYTSHEWLNVGEWDYVIY